MSLVVSSSACSAPPPPSPASASPAAGSEPAQEAPAAAEDKALSGTIVCSGATSFQPLVEAAANDFMAKNADVNISVTGGGSGQGLSDIKDGKAQIGRSDIFAESKLSEDEVAKLQDNPVAVVGMGPIVNSNVAVDDLSTEQLKGIFTGAITNWSEVGGADADPGHQPQVRLRHPRHLRGRRPRRRRGSPTASSRSPRRTPRAPSRREGLPDRELHLLPGLLLL